MPRPFDTSPLPEHLAILPVRKSIPLRNGEQLGPWQASLPLVRYGVSSAYYPLIFERTYGRAQGFPGPQQEAQSFLIEEYEYSHLPE